MLVTSILTVLSSSAFATWGDYDTTFGFLGAAVDQTVTNHTPLGVAVQPDGKILITGYRIVSGHKRFFLRRYLSNGQVDTSFGNNGSASWGSIINLVADYFGEKIVVQADGKIAVAGRANGRPAIYRFQSSGAADGGIGSGGMKVLSNYANLRPSIATYSSLLYVGVVNSSYSSSFIIKFNSSGSQDMSFGTIGEASTDARDSFSVDVDSTTGNVLVGGRSRSDALRYGVERFLTSGALDTSFNNWGATYAGWTPANPIQFVRLTNGQFVVNDRWFNVASGGGGTLGANYVRLSSNGAFTSSSQYEPTTFVPGGLEGSCPDIMDQQQDGKLVVKGQNSTKLYRFAANFSTIQTITCSSYVPFGVPTPAVLQTDDKMIAAGLYNGYLAMIRTIP